MEIVKINNLVKSFGEHKVIDNLNLKIEENKMVAIVGSSGKGKSTLLNIIGLIEPYDKGRVSICGHSALKPNTEKSAKVIRENISYLFQNYALLDNETVEVNLLIALKYINITKAQQKIKIKESLEKVGLKGYEKRKIYTLSGGEQQRVAIARLFINPKKLILADEPTGSLDTDNRNKILGYLTEMKNNGSTIIVVTHDEYVGDYCDLKISL